MRNFDERTIGEFLEFAKNRQPDFNNLLQVLKKEKPSRFTLFEFFMNEELYAKVLGYDEIPKDKFGRLVMTIDAFRALGYDYCTMYASDFSFPAKNKEIKSSISLNSGAVITDRDSFSKYTWLEPEDFDYSNLDKVKDFLPDGMKMIVMGPCGVLENVISLVGYDDLCYLLADDPELVEEIFDNVGSRLLKYYQIAAKSDSVGACVSNDDWGFNTQTMLSPELMRKYVFKWHREIVKAVHKENKPVILHSCGRLDLVYDDIIDDIKFDGKHSYEDNIQAVEDAYEMLVGRIAVMGGIDLDFVVRHSPQEIYNRACALLERTRDRGGYALGTGNSVPAYVPHDNYLAMIAAINNGN